MRGSDAMRRALSTFAFALVACVTPAPPPKPHVAIRTPPPTVSPEVEIPTDAAAAYTLAFVWWARGRTEDAMRAFRSVMASVARSEPKSSPRVRMERGPLNVARDGSRALLDTAGGLVVANADTGALERFVPMDDVTAIEVAARGLFAVTTASGVSLVDAAEGATVGRIADAQSITRGSSIFAVPRGSFVEVWSSTTRKRLCNLSEPTLTAISSISLLDEERAVLARDAGQAALWNVATCDTFIAYPSRLGITGDPALSPDGKLVAYGVVDYDATPFRGTTILLDAHTKKVLAQSHASHMPTGFAFDKDVLAVGDLRKACLLRVPQMTLIACSPEVRPSAGIDDDLQDAHPTFVASGRALAIETADGSMLVVTVPALATLWKGRARVAGSEYLFDADNHVLYAIGPTGAPTRVRTLGDDETVETLRETHPDKADASSLERLQASTCHVGSWLFPAAVCSSR